MKKFFFPFLLVAALFTACTLDNPSDEPDGPAQKRVDVCSIWSVGRTETLDSLEFDEKGQLSRFLNFEIEYDKPSLLSYSTYAYSGNKIEKKTYEVPDGKTMPGNLLETDSFNLGENGYIVSGKGTIIVEGDIAVDVFNEEYSYDAQGHLVKIKSKQGDEITYTYKDDDLVSDSLGFTYTPSGVLASNYWLDDIYNVDTPLLWMGKFGKLPVHMPAEWSMESDEVSVSGSCEYELEDRRLTGYTYSSIVTSGYTPSVTNFTIALNWIEH